MINKHTPIKGETGTYKFTNKGSKSENEYQAPIIKRKVFLPSIIEISSVVNVNDQWEMDKFLRNSSGSYLHMWVMDGRYEYDLGTMCATFHRKSLDGASTGNDGIATRPTFVIDLNKIDFINDNAQFIK